MKIIHLADVHLGASNRKLSSSLQKSLRAENGNRLHYAFDYANKINAGAIIIAGDLFHSKNPSSQLVRFFIDCVKNVPMPVVYVKGNHDEDFLFSELNMPQNFYILNNYQSIKIENVNICGSSNLTENVPKFEKNCYNVCILHGNIYKSTADYINLQNLKNKNINYLALGHLHMYESGKLDEHGVFVYPGCLTSNGFDECGEKGFVVLDTDEGSFKFVAVPGEKFCVCEVDITGFKDYADICQKIDTQTNKFNLNDFVRVVLTGFYEDGEDKFLSILQNNYGNKFAYFELVDNSRIKLDIKKLQQETLSFKAEFLKLVGLDNTLSEADKTKICEYGINALRGDDL